ncbi:MAG TPA: hypothetical protein VFV68_07400 [Agriterribacter sp.]|nr:hypothetical protein [Agriterribacter sp.]
MKTVLVIIVTCLCAVAFAQNKNSIYQNINDDGKKLSIKIKGTFNGKAVNYDKTFDVSALTAEGREALKERVYDSLGIPFPVAPIPPVPPVEPAVPEMVVEPVAPLPPVEPVEVNSDVPVVTSKSRYAESDVVGGSHPYTREITYNPQSGILHMKYRLVKKGEEVIYEKSVNARNKSMEDKQNIIKKYESEIGLDALKPQ